MRRRRLIWFVAILGVLAVFWLFNLPSDQRGPELRLWTSEEGTSPGQLQIFDGKRVAPSRTAIIFVHGLHGSHVDTFTASNGVTWFQIIADDRSLVWRNVTLAEFDVLTLGYEYAFYHPVMTSEVSKQLADHLEENGLFEHYDRVLFVAHSLGGVLIKHVLVGWADDESRRSLFMNVLGVFLIGVPSQGAPLATIADHVGIIPLLASLIGRYGLVRDLRTRDANSFLDDLEDDWRRVLRSRRNEYWRFPQIYCAYETARTGLLGRIVPRVSTLTECDGNRDRAVSVTHTALVKPPGPLDPTHLWIKSHIKRIFDSTENSRRVDFKPNLPLGELLQHGPEVTFACLSMPNKACPRLIAPNGVYWPDMKGAQAIEAFSRAHILERLAQTDECLTAKPSADFREVAITIENAVPCPGGRGYACRLELCPSS